MRLTLYYVVVEEQPVPKEMLDSCLIRLIGVISDTIFSKQIYLI